jgi:hypothetical protein
MQYWVGENDRFCSLFRLLTSCAAEFLHNNAEGVDAAVHKLRLRTTNLAIVSTMARSY